MILLHFIAATPQINLHYTDWVKENESNNGLQHDCLRVLASNDETSISREITSYCMSELPSEFHIIENDDVFPKFTFAELYKLNITSEHLYLWSAPMDIAEDYQYYLNQLSISNNIIYLASQVFYNCTLPRFGSMCQYEIIYYQSNHLSLYDIIHDYYSTHEYNPTNFTCYTHLKCNRGNFPACLDWSEICDGQIHCLDGEYDEEQCWQIDMNECNDDEYRCRNGQCIPQEFFRDDNQIPDCLDGSDIISMLRYGVIDCDTAKPSFICEELISNKYIEQYRFQNRHCDCLVQDYHFCEDEDLHIYFVRKNISFQTICDRFTELTPINITDKNETDETECEQWLCNNIYTRCDGLWNCPHGEDEIGCDLSATFNCPSGHHQCVSSLTNKFTCLPVDKANDNNIDCVGATDEPSLCQPKYEVYLYDNFYCRQSNVSGCYSNSIVCDASKDCDHRDDETFCVTNRTSSQRFGICHKSHTSIRSDVEQFLCEETKPKTKQQIKYFSLNGLDMSVKHQSKTVTKPSSSISSVNEIFHLPELQCHRGFDIRFWLNNRKNITRNTCLCPPSFYGDICQYQNQRVSLTIQFRALSDSYSTVFAIIVALIDDSEQRTIHSYEKLTYLSIRDCKVKFNIYLLYSTRPKNQTKIYAIHIDIYEKLSLNYRGSFLFPIKFPFLPVHRLPYLVDIPRKEKIQTCSNSKCIHGKCIIYSNNPQHSSFCQCNRGWSGQYCTISHVSMCSSDSIFIGVSAYNRSICACPINKFGDRCLLVNNICQIDNNLKCENGGQCIPADEYTISNKTFTCICPK
ncbi:unnamed protein product, partial [Rotaria sp. Silwood1]